MKSSESPKVKKEVKPVAKKVVAKAAPKVAKKVAAPKATSTSRAAKFSISDGKYIETVGRRKTAVARIRLYGGKAGISVNDKSYQDYFNIPRYQKTVTAPLDAINTEDKFGVSAQVQGGGITAQAEAIRHGISRALVEFNPEFRKRLKTLGFLKRDPRMVERKKYGLKKARRSPQWAKR